MAQVTIGDMTGRKVRYRGRTWDVREVLGGRTGVVCLDRMDSLHRRTMRFIHVMTPVTDGALADDAPVR